MSQKMNINSDEWCDMIFTEKNHEYGAYVIRKQYWKRQIWATLIAIIFFTVAVSSPVILKTIMPKVHLGNSDVIKVSTVDLEPPKKDENTIDEPQPEEVRSSNKLTRSPEIMMDDLVRPEDEMKMQEDLIKENKAISTRNVDGTENPNAPMIDDLNNSIIDEKPVKETVHIIVEQMPEFVGGEQEMLKYLRDNIKYPNEARQQGTTGIVYLTFIISKQGKIQNIKIIRGIGSGCDEEAIRVVESMPNWKPGKQNGSTVPVQFNLPINFKLSN